jgi:hypothetical protein
VDRSIGITLPQISEDADSEAPRRRKSEQEIWAAFEMDRPRILGALLDAVAVALRNMESVRDKVRAGQIMLPRMADFAEWVIAAEGALPWEAGGFMQAYRLSREELIGASVEADPVAAAILELAKKARRWSGSATKLLVELKALAPKGNKSKLPNGPGALSNRINRCITSLGVQGIRVERGRSEGRSRHRIITILRTGCAKVGIEVNGQEDSEDVA